MIVHLFTGFPGFIADHVICQLFEDHVTQHIQAVVQRCDLAKANERVQAIMACYPTCQLDIMEGDITLPDIGLAVQDMDLVVQNTRVLWHLAAIYDVAVSREQAWQVNVRGTVRVNELAKRLPYLERYMYFSTVYLAGHRNGVLKETELIRPHAFKNYYEESKFEAELRVEQLKKDLPITILRPSIVVGHSKTGETSKFDGLYFFMNVLDAMKDAPVIPLLGRKNTTINIVPVDFVSKVAALLVTLQEAQGKTIHVIDQAPLKVEELFRIMTFEITGRKLTGHLPWGLTKKCLENLKLRKRLGIEYEAIDYLNWDATFDCSRLQQLLATSTIKCPSMRETLPIIIAFYQENKHREELFIVVK